MTESIASGIDATNYWNVAPYSDMSFFDGDNHFEIAHIYEIFNQSFHGDLIQSQSSDNGKVIAYATAKSDENIHSFCLINRTSVSQNINFQFQNWTPSDLNWNLWDANNDFTTTITNWSNISSGNLTLTPYSVNLFVSNPNLSTTEHQKVVKIFPNPTTDKIYIPKQFVKAPFKIFSITGTEVMKGFITDNYIDLSKLEKGIYFLKIERMKVTKVIKF
jgi:hypothetical protein